MAGQYVFQNVPGGQKPFRKHLCRPKNYIIYVMLVILTVGVFMTLLNVYELHTLKLDHDTHHSHAEKFAETESRSVEASSLPSAKPQPVVWIQGSRKSNDDTNGRFSYLKHVHHVFERLGFTVRKENTDWLVMWSHDYPFVMYEQAMSKLKPYQRVNHFPGSGFITNKVTLAQSNFDFIPKAFEIPAKKNEFLQYSEQHKHFSWVQKSNSHRGIEVKDKDSLDLSKGSTFIQQFIANPFLIDGRKFDIGIYTILTSIDPLRLYVIEADALFRFCPEEYYPFDSTIKDKYVVGDDYMPMWQLPSLQEIFAEKEYSFLVSFNEYLRKLGRDPRAIWKKMTDAIKQVFLKKEANLIASMKKYESKFNFFEMVRFDFVLDEDLNIFLMEANMSPNLSSGHFAKNAKLYEHVVYNLLNLVGIGRYTTQSFSKTSAPEDNLMVTNQDIHVFPDHCVSAACNKDCTIMLVCKLCKQCLTKSLEKDLKMAFIEHSQRGSARRVFPPSISQSDALGWTQESSLLKEYNEKNKLMYLWFIGKCRLDSDWC